jgi:hypothetical protein
LRRQEGIPEGMSQEMRKSWSQLQNFTGKPELSRQFAGHQRAHSVRRGHELLTGVQRSLSATARA